MKLFRHFVLENDAEHAKLLEKTGFWGAQGAGCLIFCSSTKKFLIAHRSSKVEEPGTWGTWGGAIDAKEDPAKAAKREVEEETGYSGPLNLVSLYVYKKGSFRYSNFLAIVAKEFTPKLDWETQGFTWCSLEEWPKPLHFGLKAILADSASMATIRKHL